MQLVWRTKQEKKNKLPYSIWVVVFDTHQLLPSYNKIENRMKPLKVTLHELRLPLFIFRRTVITKL